MMSGLGFIRCKKKAALFYLFLVCLNPCCNSEGKFIYCLGKNSGRSTDLVTASSKVSLGPLDIKISLISEIKHFNN